MNYIRDMFEKKLLKSRPDFHIRQGQIDMSIEVERYLYDKRSYFVEAGTGVGKSLAYLIPVAQWAIKNNKKVIISTHSKGLQNQLLENDIPLVRSLLKEKDDLKAVVIKGRSNYVCLRRFKNLYAASNGSEEQMALWGESFPKKTQIMDIAEQIECGIGEKSLFEVSTEMIWEDICSQKHTCLKYRCPWKKKCFINKLKDEQEDAHLLIVNHALFFADFILKEAGSSLIASYEKIIFDEAHHLEDAASDSFTIEMSLFKIKSYLQLIANPNSNIGKAIRQNPDFYNKIINMRKDIEEAASDLFDMLNVYLTSLVSVEYKKDMISENNLLPLLKILMKLLASPEVKDILQLSYEAQGELDNLNTAGKQLFEEVDFLVSVSSDDYVYWMEKTKQEGGLRLKSSPIEPASILKSRFFTENEVFFTSATLAVGGTFDFIAQRLGVEEYTGKICSSPFDFKKQCLLCVPKKSVDPKGEEYDDYLIESCKEILQQTNGRCFILFTSYKSLSYCYDKMSEWLDYKGFEVFVQGKDFSPYRLLQKFKVADFPVLFGTNSFWEGVDVPGEKLSCVIMTRLPFSVPNHPLEVARMAKVRLSGSNDFLAYSVPRAVIKFRQGFGRLIRTNEDKGVVVVLDIRIKSAFYGKYFLKSLPEVSFVDSFSKIEDFFIDDTEIK